MERRQKNPVALLGAFAATVSGLGIVVEQFARCYRIWSRSRERWVSTDWIWIWICIVHTVQAEEVVVTDWVFFTIFPNPAIDFFSNRFTARMIFHRYERCVVVLYGFGDVA